MSRKHWESPILWAGFLVAIPQLLFVLSSIVAAAQLAPLAQSVQQGAHRSVSPRVSVTDVKRVSTDLVAIHVVLENTTHSDIYFPSHGKGERLRIHTLSVLHWESSRGWLPLGPFYELAADTSLRLVPGQNYTIIHEMRDPGVTPLPGEGIPLRKGESVPLQGKNKVRVGYLCNETEWKAYRAQEMGSSKNPVQLKYVDSDEFDIPPSQPSH